MSRFTAIAVEREVHEEMTACIEEYNKYFPGTKPKEFLKLAVTDYCQVMYAMIDQKKKSKGKNDTGEER